MTEKLSSVVDKNATLGVLRLVNKHLKKSVLAICFSKILPAALYEEQLWQHFPSYAHLTVSHMEIFQYDIVNSILMRTHESTNAYFCQVLMPSLTNGINWDFH